MAAQRSLSPESSLHYEIIDHSCLNKKHCSHWVLCNVLVSALLNFSFLVLRIIKSHIPDKNKKLSFHVFWMNELIKSIAVQCKATVLPQQVSALRSSLKDETNSLTHWLILSRSQSMWASLGYVRTDPIRGAQPATHRIQRCAENPCATEKLEVSYPQQVWRGEADITFRFSASLNI